MAAGTYFVRACPTCGRTLEIRVEWLNRKVECSHCHGVFLASEREERPVSDQKIEQILARTQDYLAAFGNHSTASELG